MVIGRLIFAGLVRAARPFAGSRERDCLARQLANRTRERDRAVDRAEHLHRMVGVLARQNDQLRWRLGNEPRPFEAVFHELGSGGLVYCASPQAIRAATVAYRDAAGELADAKGLAAAFIAAHAPGLGLERSVCLRDLVEAPERAALRIGLLSEPPTEE